MTSYLKCCLSALLLVTPAACSSSEPAPTRTQPVPAASTLTLQVEAPSYMPYERIVLLAEYSGASAPVLLPEAGEIQVIVDGPGHAAQALRPLARYCAGVETGPRPTSALIDVTSDQTGWQFAQPGTYTVRLRSVDGSLVSNAVELRVVEPQRIQDIEARDAIARSKSFADFLRFDGGDRFPSDLELATKLAEGDSVYRSTMRDLLVRHYARQSVTLDRRTRAPVPEKALRYYDGASEATSRAFTKAGAVWYLSRLQQLEPATVRLDLDGERLLLERKAPRFRFANLQGTAMPQSRAVP